MGLAVAAIAFSCGDARSPLDSVSSTPSQAPVPARIDNPTGTDFIVFGAGAFSAQKRVTGTTLTRSVTKTVKVNKNEKLKVTFPKYDSDLRVQKVEFEIQKNSIGFEGARIPAESDGEPASRHRVTMEVTTGQALSNILVGFEPSGMTFNPAARLTFRVIGELDPNALTAYHVSKNGKVSKPRMVVRQRKSREWDVLVAVGGFSEYSMDEEGQEGDE
jgi:hypothetical protein